MKFHIQENPNPTPAYQAHLEIRDEENQVVAVINGGHEKATANAAFIVRACNSHAALVEALERAEIRLEGTADFIEQHCTGENATSKLNIVRSIQDECRAALALAKGE